MLIWLLAVVPQEASIDDLLRAFGDESVEVRQRAAERILAKWKTWTDAELTRIEAATSSTDAEVSKKAADVLATIRFYRGIPERARNAFPEAGRILRSGAPDEVAGLFDALLAAWEKRELSSLEVLPLVMISLGDERKTSRTEPARFGGVWHMPASFPAFTLLHAALPRFYYNTPPDVVRAWWKENRAKPERDWHLPDLTSPDERHRAGAIRRLFALGEPALHPGLFEALKTIQEDYSFEIAVKDAAAWPADLVRRELKGYLGDARLKVRFVAARLLHPSEPRAALDALSTAFESGRESSTRVGFSTDLREIVEWMVRTKDDRAFAALRSFLKTGDFHSRFSALSAMGYVEDERVDDALIGMFGDTDRTTGSMLAGDVRNPRLCDYAGILLAKRLKLLDGAFQWPEDRIDVRNANLAEIWKSYRKKKGLPPAPFPVPGVSPVPPESVAALRPDLLSDDPGRRKAALAKLSRLGAGAWPHLQEEALKDVALAFSNTLRRADGDEKLKARLHEPFDPDLFFQESVAPWFGDPEAVEIDVLITREPEGGGITVRLELRAREPGTGPFDQFSAEGNGGGFLAGMRRTTYDEAWTKYFAPLKDDMKTGSGGQFKSGMRMKKTRSK